MGVRKCESVILHRLIGNPLSSSRWPLCACGTRGTLRASRAGRAVIPRQAVVQEHNRAYGAGGSNASRGTLRASRAGRSRIAICTIRAIRPWIPHRARSASRACGALRASRAGRPVIAGRSVIARRPYGSRSAMRARLAARARRANVPAARVLRRDHLVEHRLKLRYLSLQRRKIGIRWALRADDLTYAAYDGELRFH